jgi:hypothetical protein
MEPGARVSCLTRQPNGPCRGRGWRIYLFRLAPFFCKLTRPQWRAPTLANGVVVLGVPAFGLSVGGHARDVTSSSSHSIIAAARCFRASSPGSMSPVPLMCFVSSLLPLFWRWFSDPVFGVFRGGCNSVHGSPAPVPRLVPGVLSLLFRFGGVLPRSPLLLCLRYVRWTYRSTYGCRAQEQVSDWQRVHAHRAFHYWLSSVLR